MPWNQDPVMKQACSIASIGRFCPWYLETPISVRRTPTRVPPSQHITPTGICGPRNRKRISGTYHKGWWQLTSSDWAFWRYCTDCLGWAITSTWGFFDSQQSIVFSELVLGKKLPTKKIKPSDFWGLKRLFHNWYPSRADIATKWIFPKTRGYLL